MAPLSSFAVSVIANIVTQGVSRSSQKGLDSKLKAAYVRALRHWTKHDVDWESNRYKERLVDLADYMQNPSGKTRFPSDIELLNYYKDELKKDAEVWFVIEDSLLTYIAAITTDTNKLLTEINTFLSGCNVSQKEFEDNVRRLLDLQLRRNIANGKYLEDTYLEVDELKERLRFFVDPSLFLGLTIERVARLNFDDLRWKLSEKNEGEFDFSADEVVYNADSVSFELLYEASRRLADYLADKYDELKRGGNIRYFQARKIGRILRLNDCHHKRLFVLTSKAGQGKTNILCDLTKNVLIKRKISAAYLNGYELDVNSIERSFARKLFPTKNYTLDDILQAARCYCEQNKVPFVFIIDGLNENSSPLELRASLETFISSVLRYDFVKVILSCRTEYYNIHFASVGQLFSVDTIIQKDINSRLHNDWDKLKELYFKHFSISCQEVVEKIKDKFCDNLLLFRIFCEVNKGKRLNTIHSIAKEPLFDSYCELMIKRVADELNSEGYSMASEALIAGFLQDIIGSMVQTGSFANMPLTTICNGADDQLIMVINRFLDNNVLVRKDLMPDNRSPFKNSEVVNFTFDEFRDYLVSHYLVDKVLQEGLEAFHQYVEKYTDAECFLSEGLITFLFPYVKRIKNSDALDILKEQQWYMPLFREMIWDLEEECVDDADIELVKECLRENDILVSRSLVYWGRWDTQSYKKLNIKLLLNYLSELNLEGLRSFFDKVWPNTHKTKYYEFPGQQIPSPRETLLSQLRNLLDGDNAIIEHVELNNLFELVLYLSVIDYPARYLYDAYNDKTHDTEQICRVINNTCCDELTQLAKAWL